MLKKYHRDPGLYKIYNDDISAGHPIVNPVELGCQLAKIYRVNVSAGLWCGGMLALNNRVFSEDKC